MSRPSAIIDLETIASEVPLSAPRSNMANEVLSRLGNFEIQKLNQRLASMGGEHGFKNTDRELREFFEIRAHPGDFPPPPCWKIVCIGAAFLDENGMLEDLACLDGETELEMLQELARILGEDPRFKEERRVLVSFNGRRFDVPVACMRAFRHGIALPRWCDNWHYRYSNQPHFDLLDYWTGRGASPNVSLHQMCRLIGLPGKKSGEDGGSVEAMVKEGRLAEVKTYCLSDVVQTAGLFVRTEYFRGRMTREQYRARAMRLLEACEGAFDPGLAWVSAGTDRKVFLLED